MACLLYPAGKMPATSPFPAQTIEDLQLGRLAKAMSPSDYYRLTPEELCALFTGDEEVLRHRQAVFRDVLRFPELESAMEKLLDSLDGWESRGGSRRGGADAFAVGFSLDEFTWLDGYLKKIDAAWREFDRIPVESAGFRALQGLLNELRNSKRYQDAASDFKELCPGFSAPARMRLGYNLDNELKPSRLKLLAMEPPEEGTRSKSAQKRKMMLTQRAV